jgi:hypothetical protein
MLKAANSDTVSPGSGSPAAVVPARTPGSLATKGAAEENCEPANANAVLITASDLTFVISQPSSMRLLFNAALGFHRDMDSRREYLPMVQLAMCSSAHDEASEIRHL